MHDYISGFADQLKEALLIAERSQLNKKEAIQNIVVTGLGGSGIGGSLMAEMVADDCKLPILINKDYFLPAFVNEKTLLIVSSYSGNTEETLSCLDQAIERKAVVVCITSGGKVLELARANGFDFIIVPGGNPPRTCLGYSLVQLFHILYFNQLITLPFSEQIRKAILLIETEKEDILAKASAIATQTLNKLPVIYSLGNTAALSERFRQQINENSKLLSWHHVIPEMNHNELVGWTGNQSNIFVIILRTKYDYSKNIKRLEISKEVFSKCNSQFVELTAKGESRIEQYIYLIHLTDWVSSFLADLRKVDAVEVNVIDYLKTELAK